LENQKSGKVWRKMIATKANLLENQLRQKLIQFEHSLARISDTRKHLRDNADLVKSEIRATFGSQLTQMRRREQQLLETLDAVASVKDGILSEQQDQLHQALGACMQGLEWYQTAVEDMKESRLTSIDTVELHINDVLKKLSVVDIKPRETAVLSFESDPLAIRKAISSFGHVRTVKTTTAKSFESLPAQLEDYDEEDLVHSLLHKAVNRHHGKNATTIFVGRPTLSNDPKDWLLREALTGHHSAPLTPENQPEVCMKHCSTATALTTMDGGGKQNENINNLRQAQVHSWLHHIKNQVENEPNVFEDFEIVKDREVKNSMAFDSIKAELSDDVTALFRPYFEAVLLSPASQWLLKSMEKIDFTTFNGMVKTATSVVKADPLVQEYAFEGDIEDMDSCPSTMTYESSGEFLDPIRSNNTNLTQETYSKLWHQFVDALWNSTDSLWILPCCSEEKPRPLANNVSSSSAATPKSNNDQWLSPSSQEHRQKMVSDVIDQLILNRLDNVSLNENRHHHHRKVDYDQWLMKSSDQQKSTAIDDLNSMEDWLGWKALLEKQGDQCWLSRSPNDSTTKGEQSERVQKIDWITGGDPGQMDF
jgi:hypothetical protein